MDSVGADQSGSRTSPDDEHQDAKTVKPKTSGIAPVNPKERSLDEGGSRSKPKTLADLTPDQRRKYEEAKAARRAGQASTDTISESPDQKGSPEQARSSRGRGSEGGGDKSGEDKGKEKAKKVEDLTPEQRAKYERSRAQQREKERGEGEKNKPKRLQDLTEEEREKYMAARAERKAKERAKLKIGQGSGLSAEEKEALTSS